jgi:adenylate cyclase class 2
MNEVEVKILEIDATSVEKKLKALGAKKVFDGQLTWTAFDFPDRRLSGGEVLLRLRKEGDKTFLTLKRLLNRDAAKVSDETQITVDDYENMKKILLNLGLVEKKGYPLSKKRVSYVLNDMHFEIDTFPEFPTYLEIESTDTASIKEYVKKLGYSEADAKPWGAREVFAHYRSKGI